MTKLICRAVLLLFIATFEISRANAELPSPLLQAFNARTKATRTLHLRWREQTVQHDDPRAPLKPDTRYGELRIKNGMVDFREARLPGEIGPFPMHRALWDGQDSREYTPASKTPNGTLIVDSVPNRFTVTSLHLRPFFINYRPLEPSFGRISAEEYEVREGTFEVAGRACCVVQERESRTIRKEYWFDTQRDYLLLRYVSRIHNRDSIRQDIVYAEGADNGWLPKSWKSVYVNEAGELMQSTECVVEYLQLNVPIDDAEFSLTETDLKDQAVLVSHLDDGKPVPTAPSQGLVWPWLVAAAFLIAGIAIATQRFRSSV